jgi:hypothetical protein
VTVTVTVTVTGVYGGLTSWFSILCRLACSCPPRSRASPSPESAAVRIGDEYRDGGGALSARRTWGGDDGKERKGESRKKQGVESQ